MVGPVGVAWTGLCVSGLNQMNGMRMRTTLLLTGFSLLTPLVTGCASFGASWKAAGRDLAPMGEFRGRWEGTWTSDANGHSGRLRSVITEVGEGIYRAKFHATFAGFLTFTTETDLSASRDGDTWRFMGKSDLGWLAGGEYEYEGEATDRECTFNYRSKFDHGVFRMTRKDQPQADDDSGGDSADR